MDAYKTKSIITQNNHIRHIHSLPTTVNGHSNIYWVQLSFKANERLTV